MKKVIGVRFDEKGMLSEKEYSYFTDIPDLQVGDWVVVDVNDTFKCVMVTTPEGMSKAAICKASKWVVQKVDVTEYKARAEKLKVIAEIRNQLHQAKEEAEEYLIYQQLAAVNPGIASLLTRLHELDPESCPLITGGK